MTPSPYTASTDAAAAHLDERRLRRVNGVDVDPREPPEHHNEGLAGEPNIPPPVLTLREAIGMALFARYCVKHFAHLGEVCVLFGESGSLKSFLTLDLGMHVASGAVRWFGRRVRTGAVLFVVAEGAKGMPKRLRAWIQAHLHDALGRHPSDAEIDAEAAKLPVALHQSPIDLFVGPGALGTVIRHAEQSLGQPIRLVVIDPLGLMLGEGSEQANTDIARVFNNLRAAIGPDRAALLVHHAGHGEKGRERGAITIRTNADARFQVELDPASHVLTLGHLKEKDGPLADDTYLTFRAVPLGVDDDGDEVTSLILRATVDRPAPPEDRKVGLSVPAVKALRALGSVWRGVPVSPTDWRRAMHSSGQLSADEPDDSTANRRTFQRLAKALTDAGLVERLGTTRDATYRLIGSAA